MTTFKPNEISFILNKKNNTFASQLYDNTNHCKKGIHYIDKETKLVVFYCNNNTRSKIYNYAKELGIHDKIIYIQPIALQQKTLQYEALRGSGINIPEYKFFLDDNDDISDQIVKPPEGFYGNGIEFAKTHITYNRFYQKFIDKVKEYRVVWCKWFTKDNQCRIIEKHKPQGGMLTQNYSNGQRLKANNVYDDITNDIEIDIVNNLISQAKIIINSLNYCYCAIDIMVDKNGKYQFLECNSMTNQDNAYKEDASVNAKRQHKNLFNNLFTLDREYLYNLMYKKIEIS